MKCRGDAVGQQLPFGLGQRQIEGEADAGARLDLPLEGVAVDVDNAGQHLQPARVQHRATTAARRDTPLGDPQITGDEPSVGKQHLAAGNPQWPHH